MSERELNQHLPTTKSGGILRLCHRRNHHGYALAEGVEGLRGEARTRDCSSLILCLRLSGGGLRR